MSFAAEMRDFLGSMKVIHDMGVDNDRTAKIREEAKKLKADREGLEKLTDSMTSEAAANKAGGLSKLASSAIPVPGGSNTTGISSAAPAASSTRVDDDDDDDDLSFANGGSVPAASGRRPPVRQEELADYVDMALQGLEQWIAQFFRAGQAIPAGEPGGGNAIQAIEAAAKEVDQYKAEIAQVDKALDPRGVLSEDEIAEIRLGAMMKWKLMKGDHKGAMEIGRALLAFSDLQSRRYAGLAATALQKGDTKAAAFYGERAASSVIDGKRYKAMPRPDGSFDVAVKDPYTGKVEKAVMTAQQLGQMANGVMVGKGMQGAMNFAQTHAKGRYVGGFDRGAVENLAYPPRAGRRGSRGPAAPADTSQTRAALGAIRTAAQKLQAAEDSGDENAIRTAQAELEAAKNRFRDMPTLGRGNPETTLANRERLISMAAGESAPGRPSGTGSGSGGGGGGGTADERRERGAARELDAVARKRAAIEAGAPNSFGGPTGAVGPVVARPDPNVGRMVEAVDVERTRRAANKNLDLTAADAAFRGAEARKAFTKDFADLAEPVKNAIDAVSGTEGNSVLDEKQKRELLDLSIRVLSRSDANPETVVRQLYDSMYAPQGSKGYGPTPYKVDKQGGVRFGQPGEGGLRYDEAALPIAADDLRRIDRVAGETSRTLLRADDVEDTRKAEKEKRLERRDRGAEDFGLGALEFGQTDDYLLDKLEFK